MTLDKTLQKIIQRAEFDEETFWEFCNQLKEHPGIQFEYDKCGKFENARLLPIIVGLCEEVQRLSKDRDELLKELENPSDKSFQRIIVQWMERSQRYSTSGLEKLGGGDD